MEWNSSGIPKAIVKKVALPAMKITSSRQSDLLHDGLRDSAAVPLPVVEQDDPDGVEQQRNPEGHREEGRFAGDEDHQLPALRARDRLVADATADELSEIVKKLPLDGQQSVERPEVEVLPPVIRETPLMRSQPGEETEIDVGVMACDIDIGVMQDDVLPPPQVGAPADQFQRHRHEFVDPGRSEERRVGKECRSRWSP